MVNILKVLTSHRQLLIRVSYRNTWNKYGCNIEARLIRETADIMVSKGWWSKEIFRLYN
jgi:hypothetical protein